jgi:hypothetical protein
MPTEAEIKAEILAAVTATAPDKLPQVEREVDEWILREDPNHKKIIQTFYKQWKSITSPDEVGDENAWNSTTAYVLGLTNKAPAGDFFYIKRRTFARPEPPDIDSDFDYEYRDMILAYLVRKYGRGRVGNIGTYQELKLRSYVTRAVKALDLANRFGTPEYTPENVKKVTEILDRLPKSYGAILKVKDENGEEHPIKTTADAYKWCKDFRFYMDRHPEIMQHAANIEGLRSIFGVHASGIVLSDVPLDEIAPLRTAKVTGDEVAYATQFAYEDLALLGLIKFDILAISTLTVIARCLKMVKENYGITLDIENLPLSDKKTLDLYKSGDLTGVFQCESEKMQQTCVDVGVDRFSDIAAVISLFRPGPMDSIPDYCNCKWGRKKVSYFHPTIEPHVKAALADTYGVLCYQEQVMMICVSLGDMTPTEALIVIKGISKKKADVIEKGHAKFVEGAQRKGVPKDIIEQYWAKFIMPFSSYGFNKSLLETTLVKTPLGDRELQSLKKGDEVYSVNEQGQIVVVPVVELHNHGELEGYEVTFDDGSQVNCSINHKFLTPLGQMPLWEIWRTRSQVFGTHIHEAKIMDNEMRHANRWQSEQGSSSGELQPVQRVGMEKKGIRRDSCTSVSLWSLFSEGKIAKRTHAWLRKMFGYQSTQYSNTHGKAQSRQSITRAEIDIFCNSQKDFCTSGHSGRQGSTVEEVARRQSGEVSRMYTCGAEKPEKVENGSLDEKSVGVGVAENPVRRFTATGRFSVREYLDRSRWVLPLLRSEAYEDFVRACSAERRSSQLRSQTQEGCNATQDEHGVFHQFFRPTERRVVAGGEHYATVSDTRNMVPRHIVRIMPVGKRRMFDLEVACSTHNFLLANGLVTSNSHALAYAYLSYQTAYLKANFPEEFICSYLNVELVRRKLERVSDLEREAARMGIFILPRDINKCEKEYTIVKKKDESAGIPRSEIRPAVHCKGLPVLAGENIVDRRPYKSVRDLAMKTDTSLVDHESVTALCDAGFFKTKKEQVLQEFEIIREDLKRARKMGRDSGNNIFGDDDV